MEQVVAAAAAGEDFAWELLFQRFDGVTRAVARSLRLGEQDADDMAQTTWLRLLENIEHLRSADALGAWLWVTARREGLRLLRLRGRELPTEAPEPEDVATDCFDDTEARRRSAVLRAIGKLPDERRA